ncbi:MAG: LytTR family DNA-binding domain-containing protein [Pseudomonadota bacterium]
MSPYTAIIADDEPLLLDALRVELATAWPALQVVAAESSGEAARNAIFRHKPTVAFLDINMPGASGIEIAQSIVEDWPDRDSTPAPLVVFTTAFDQYAVAAFEAAACDYLLKPVTAARLTETVRRLRERVRITSRDDTALTTQLQQLLHAVPRADTPQQTRLQIIRASSGSTVRVIPVEDVILFESADKYVTVHTADGEALIREPLKSLLPQLDPDRFQQIHRSAIVNLLAIRSATRDDSGKVTLQLDGCDKQPSVSRVYRHLFQAM